ncbi:cupin domain-containing protein [Pseudomonas chlororaphis]|uniref:Cupin n=1 Tax=Pseudomonas chlororaphis TaxID=587753 RepID=A0AAX3FPC4_9PSED|nr:cupin domain-containing protein [Pseudomonas chlororaphis]AZC37776.1 Nucleoside-diphosphate-sugar epimerase [Pseudomonas chlororaphis subsp. piscium]AZC44324.1 Nucleoside-diphosphate-sugar epimerase [Pseudomonas chlororaphis subsp. piscium]AZC57555.1 Nucleoside-diphosphate-sugar epimerase [Pseudomonas chlororaphis subsp. piscium]AZC63774.1 Nucleoside-diphosphate-sugar epimerase [Pseudomonas chlororaphis subsp. piscium]AZC70012.1 Nucleoside-diphosphate-sugar epimerase [Pseudomonas chlororaph
MSITQFKNTAHATLEHSAPVAVPLGSPVAVTSVTCVERNDGVETGIWECTPGRWRRQIVAREFCHFIQGRCTFIPDNGEPLLIEAGDALMLPANSTGTWDIQETVRKTYVLIF